VFAPDTIGFYLDWRTQEVGVAAAFSGDRALMEDYATGDVYHALARMCGLTDDPDPIRWKKLNRPQRDRMKPLQLGINYGMGVPSLAHGLDRHPLIASEIIERHKRRYPRLASYLDRGCTCWTALENKPFSLLSGIFQQRRGVKSGVPDVEVIQRQPGRLLVVFVELKSRAGVASKTQKQFRLEVLAAGAEWWMARSARAAMTALYGSGVAFRRPWKPPSLEPWEGPFADPHRRLPQEPGVAARRRAEQRQYRERQRARQDAEIARLPSGENALQSPSAGAAP
jgi:hypothetical protein